MNRHHMFLGDTSCTYLRMSDEVYLLSRSNLKITEETSSKDTEQHKAAYMQNLENNCVDVMLD